MMSNGASGDINNIPFLVTRPPREPFEQIRIVAAEGRRHRVARACRDRDPSSGRAPGHDPARGDAEASPPHRRADRGGQSRARHQRPSRARQAPASGRELRPQHAFAGRSAGDHDRAVQAMRIGDLAVCAIPFEAFVEIGLDLKKRSPFPRTMVIGLANGRNGYLPTPEQHKLGGYETWLGTTVQEDASVILTEQPARNALLSCGRRSDAHGHPIGKQAVAKCTPCPLLVGLGSWHTGDRR